MANQARTALLASVFIVSGVAVFGVSSAKAATVISSSAYGIDANLSILNTVTASLGPVAAVSGTAPASYDLSKTALSANANLGAGVQLVPNVLPFVPPTVVSFGDHLSTGLITSTASSPFTPTPTGTATSTINNLSTDLRSDILGLTLVDYLGLGATTITSTSSVSGVGGVPTATGSSIIEGLSLNGTLFQGLNLDLNALAAAAPNTVLLSLPGLSVVLNEQILGGDGVTSRSIQTNAIDVVFSDYLLGGNLLSGNLTIGHSQASISGLMSAAPEPAVWVEMIAGFGFAGFAMRRRRARAAIAA